MNYFWRRPVEIIKPRNPSVGELEDRFRYHPPSEVGVKTHAVLSEGFIEIAETVASWCPPSRETSIALTKLEEAKFWASAAVARNPDTR